MATTPYKPINRGDHWSIVLTDGFTIAGNHPSEEAAQQACDKMNEAETDHRARCLEFQCVVDYRRETIASEVKKLGLRRRAARVIGQIALAMMARDGNEQLTPERAVALAIDEYQTA